jgi:hypothetical protein
MKKLSQDIYNSIFNTFYFCIAQLERNYFNGGSVLIFQTEDLKEIMK